MRLQVPFHSARPLWLLVSAAIAVGLGACDSAQRFGKPATAFRASVSGDGEISIPADGHDDVTRRGPIVEILPAGDQMEAILSASTCWATSPSGARSAVAYVVPIDLHDNTMKSTGALETWIPPTNTFTRRYNAFGAGSGFIIRFKTKEQPVRLGLVFQEDQKDLSRMHLLDNDLSFDVVGTSSPTATLR